MSRILLLAFGIAFFLGVALAFVGAWRLWRRIAEARHKGDKWKTGN